MKWSAEKKQGGKILLCVSLLTKFLHSKTAVQFHLLLKTKTKKTHFTSNMATQSTLNVADDRPSSVITPIGRSPRCPVDCSVVCCCLLPSKKRRDNVQVLGGSDKRTRRAPLTGLTHWAGPGPWKLLALTRRSGAEAMDGMAFWPRAPHQSLKAMGNRRFLPSSQCLVHWTLFLSAVLVDCCLFFCSFYRVRLPKSWRQ